MDLLPVSGLSSVELKDRAEKPVPGLASCEETPEKPVPGLETESGSELEQGGKPVLGLESHRGLSPASLGAVAARGKQDAYRAPEGTLAPNGFSSF